MHFNVLEWQPEKHAHMIGGQRDLVVQHELAQGRFLQMAESGGRHLARVER